MNTITRRSMLGLLVTLLTPQLLRSGEASHPGGELERWSNRSTVPVTPWKTAVAHHSTYPVHGVSWHITGSSETREELINHLLTSSHHGDVRGVYTRADLEQLSRAQLLTMHDDSHNHVLVNTKRQAAVSQPVQVYSSPVYTSNCPNGRCPLNTTRSGNGGTRIRTNFFTGLNFF